MKALMEKTPVMLQKNNKGLKQLLISRGIASPLSDDQIISYSLLLVKNAVNILLGIDVEENRNTKNRNIKKIEI